MGTLLRLVEMHGTEWVTDVHIGKPGEDDFGLPVGCNLKRGEGPRFIAALFSARSEDGFVPKHWRVRIRVEEHDAFVETLKSRKYVEIDASVLTDAQRRFLEV